MPSALITYGALVPLAAAVTRGRTRKAALAPLAAYAAVVGVGAVAIAATLRKPTTLPLAAALIAELHVCYGAGVLRGLTERRRAAVEPEVSAWIDLTDQPDATRVMVEPA